MNNDRKKQYLAAYYIMNKDRRLRNLENLKTDFKREELLFYKERMIAAVKCNLVPRRFQFVFKKWVGEYVIDKDNQKFVSAEFLSWFFTKSYLETCESLNVRKTGQFIKINRESALIKKDSDIDLVLRIIESNKRKGVSRKWIYLENGERVNIELTHLKIVDY